ncbi:hypothetical protein [Nocardia sp. NBC_01329]|uniref:hypothetical protein n=1 Tax=Nocardia sp. NBC_01329 TaxID=2903594 RepID=UPI002E0E6815|nr:hypothetical protein OG405_08330 [Nocardia sp. NBC_01329]
MDPSDGHTTELVLSIEECDAVRAALTEVTRPGDGEQAPSLNYLLARWRGLVNEAEEAYPWCASEFSNDLYCRDMLGEVWPLLPPRARRIVQPDLDRIDERYRRATVPWPGRPEDGAQWWQWRVPRRIEIEASEQRDPDWPMGWAMMPFPRPTSVEVVT